MIVLQYPLQLFQRLGFASLRLLVSGAQLGAVVLHHHLENVPHLGCFHPWYLSDRSGLALVLVLLVVVRTAPTTLCGRGSIYRRDGLARLWLDIRMAASGQTLNNELFQVSNKFLLISFVRKQRCRVARGITRSARFLLFRGCRRHPTSRFMKILRHSVPSTPTQRSHLQLLLVILGITAIRLHVLE